jgi:hypothetical protein
VVGEVDAAFDGPRAADGVSYGLFAEGLRGVRPNPARGALEIELAALPDRSRSLRIVDVAGRLVRELEAGDGPTSVVVWDGRDTGGQEAAGGVYFVVLRLDDEVWTRKVLRVR